MNKNRISELLSLLENPQPGILVLVGPSGSGKSFTLHLVLKQLSLDFSAVSFDDLLEFRQFMDSTCKYSALDHFTSDKTAAFLDIYQRRRQMVKIVVVKEAPFCISHLASLQKFTQLLQKYSKHILLIFTFTESLFSEYLASAFTRISHRKVEFKSIARTHVAQALGISLRRGTTDQIVDSCDGDLRSAKLSAQFLRLIPTKDCQGRPRKKLKYDSIAVDMHKDVQLDLFHALGKILYAKRLDKKSLDNRLPPHLVDFERFRPKDDLFQVMESIATMVDPSHFLLHLHANLPDFIHYSATENMERLSTSLDYLSIGDLYSNSFDILQEELCLAISSLGLFFSNDNSSSGGKLGFYSFRKIDYVQQVVKLNRMEEFKEYQETHFPSWTLRKFLIDFYPFNRMLPIDRISGLVSTSTRQTMNWWEEEDDIME